MHRPPVSCALCSRDVTRGSWHDGAPVARLPRTQIALTSQQLEGYVRLTVVLPDRRPAASCCLASHLPLGSSRLSHLNSTMSGLSQTVSVSLGLLSLVALAGLCLPPPSHVM